MSEFVRSIDVAIKKLEDAVILIAEATFEVRKHNHPADGELAGLQHQTEQKIRRLQELKRFEMGK